jgi:hypothetical protein
MRAWNCFLGDDRTMSTKVEDKLYRELHGGSLHLQVKPVSGSSDPERSRLRNMIMHLRSDVRCSLDNRC